MNRKFISNSNYVLRKVLNNENAIDILKNLIEAILEIDIKEIELNKYLKVKERYLPSEENFGIADVRIKTNEGEDINVGIQFIDGKYIKTKMLMYYYQIHLNQLEHDRKREFAKTITINFLDFIFLNSLQYQNEIKIKTEYERLQLEELEMYIIELPKVKCNNIINISKKEQWLLYLKGENSILLNAIKKNNEKIKLLDYLAEEYWKKEKMQ